MASSPSFVSSEDIGSIFLTGLRNAHALEKEALQIMERQVERLQHYPEMEQLLRRHIEETKAQEQRLDDILDALGSDRSVLKDIVTQVMGNMAAIAHAPAGDEILKNTFANHAFENYEIAAYRSLIAMAEAAGESRFVSPLRQTLREEENAARQIAELIEPITRKYLSRASSGAKADR